jgi:transposase
VRIWCGIDWSERHHDVALVDDDGVLIAKRRIPDSAGGFRQLLELLAEHRERSDVPIPVAIETAKGLLPAALRAAGYQLFPINPLAVSRYRDRYAVSRAKSDPGDALVLANILRTDRTAHRPLPEDSELAGSIRVLARAQQDAVWDRQQAANKLRSLLREYYPSLVATFEDLTSSDARATLGLAPTPAAVTTLSRARLRAALARAGRRRNLDELERALGEAFAQHPDAAIITSFPGLGTVLGARILGEIGDDRSRFADAKALKAFAGTAPVTRASGRKRSVTRRVVRNRRLCQAGYLWALPLLTHSPGARAHYEHRRERGDSYNAAARHLANRYFGILFHCLQNRLTYDETKAFPTPTKIAA